MSPEHGRRGAGRCAAEGSTIRLVVGAVWPTLKPPIRADAISAIWPGSNYRPAAGPLPQIASRLSRLRSHWTTLTSSSSTARTEIPRLAIQLASRTMFHAAPTAGERRVSLLLPPSLGQACEDLIATVRSAVDHPRPGVVGQHRPWIRRPRSGPLAAPDPPRLAVSLPRAGEQGRPLLHRRRLFRRPGGPVQELDHPCRTLRPPLAPPDLPCRPRRGRD